MPVPEPEHLHRMYPRTIEQSERLARQRQDIEARRAELWARVDQFRARGAPGPETPGPAPTRAAEGVETEPVAATLLPAGPADCVSAPVPLVAASSRQVNV